MVKGARVVPVFAADVATLGSATAVQDNSEDAAGWISCTAQAFIRLCLHERDHRNDLDDREHKLCFTVALDTEQVDTDYDGQEYSDPSGVGDRGVPIVNRDRGSDDFERQDNEPLHRVVPAHSETPRRIQKAGGICGEGTSDGEQDGHLAESVDGTIQHDTDQTEGDEQRSRTTICQSLSRSYKETSTCAGVSIASDRSRVERGYTD